MPNKFLIIILILLSPFFFLNTVYSEVYKWIDEDGNVAYGDKPTSSDATKIEINNTPKQDSHYQERSKKQKKLLDVFQEERDEKTALNNEKKEKKEKQKQKCAGLRKELQEMKDAQLIYEKTDDPDNPLFLSDEKRKAEEIKYEKYINKNC